MSIVEQAATIEAARRNLPFDWDLALYMVRDLGVTAQAGLTNLCWAMHNYNSTRDEVASILDTLTDHIQEAYNEGISRE